MLLTCLLIPLALSAGGCGFWDDFRANDYSIKAVFHPPDPVEVIRSGTTDGNKLARAYGRLREPLQNKGTQVEQDFVVMTLTKAAVENPQAWCRLKAIESLRTFKDPRAVQGIVDAYYKADSFSPDTRSVLRIQSLTALGNFADHDGEAVDLLVRVVQQPPVESAKSSEDEKQMYLDERLAAARSLEHSKNYRATEALVQVLRNEKDVALRDRAHKSLVAVTGKNLPPDAKAWEDLLNNPGQAPERSVVQGPKGSLFQPVVRTSATEKK